MQKIILYSSNQLKKIPLTGGIRRFFELANNIGNYCDLTVISGDEMCEFPSNVKHISTHQKNILPTEKKLALHNRHVLNMIKKNGYDWIISFDVPPSVWLVLFRMPHLCLMIRKDFIGYEKIILRGKKNNIFIRNLVIFVYKMAELITLLYSEKIIVQCNYDKKQLLKRHIFFSGFIKKKIFVQINNVNPSWLEASKIVRVEKKSVLKIGSVNSFADLRKGCDIFLESIAYLINNGFSIDATIAGDGLLYETFKEKYKKYETIHFVGRISNPGDFIKRFNLVVVPSRADSCPNTVMEALFNGVPVIASNVGGIPEILVQKEALFEPNSFALSKKIISLLELKKIEELVYYQKQRAENLKFDWPKKIFQIIIGGNDNE